MEANRKHDVTAAEAAELSTESQDKSRKRKKKAKAALSFVIMALLLLALFFASVNIGSLKVGFGELLQGLLGNASENAATVFDLRFPRILISMLAVIKSCIPLTPLRLFVCVTMVGGTLLALALFPSLLEIVAVTMPMAVTVLIGAAVCFAVILILEQLRKAKMK